jgi:hypothetical protein
MTRTFGPGSMESLELRVWTARTRYGRRQAGDPRQLRAEVRGTFDVFTEYGVERVWIEQRESAWTSEDSDAARRLAAARDGDEDAAEALAGDLVNWALEDWAPEVVA